MFKVRLTGDQARDIAHAEAEIRELRQSLDSLVAQHRDAVTRLTALTQAHSGLFITFVQLAQAQAGRDLVTRDAMLAQIVEHWQDMQGRGALH